jgi:mannitol-1-phosphate 5-dehydrogenase
MKLVQFGAGNIGRSFIGQLFSRAGYEVVFVDINATIIQELNHQRQYRVMIKRNDLSDETIWVRNVRGVHASDREQVVAEIANASILATAVGKSALPHILPAIAQGLQKRLQIIGEVPLDVIMAENVRNVADYVYTELQKLLPAVYKLDELVGLVETSIGKMVPIMKAEDVKKDPLWVFAEPYNTLIVDRKGFKNPIPVIEGIAPKENMAAFVDRKLFIHNLGHAAAAYFGYQHNPNFVYIYEALDAPELFAKVRRCMLQSAIALNREYPADLPLLELEEHIDDLLSRFQNRALGDTIFRVGRDLYRKLERDDRLVGAMVLAKKHACPCDLMAAAVLAACHFRATDEHGQLFPGDQKFAEQDFPQGLEHILAEVCHLSREHKFESEVIEEILYGAL